MNGVMLRRACESDVAAMIVIASAQSLAPQWPAATYMQLLRDGQHEVFIAEEQGSVLGFIVVALVLDEVEIESIVVEAWWHRRGVGRQLVEAVIQWAQEHRAGLLRLEVRKANAPAQALYQSLGFAPCGLRRSYYTEPPDDAVLLQLLLAGGV